MNFYLDFEANQYSERIISIGCIAENGARFETLVKPVKNEKVTAFITKLTGITNEMLKNAPSADEAFNAFYEFVKTNNEGGTPTYYCYEYIKLSQEPIEFTFENAEFPKGWILTKCRECGYEFPVTNLYNLLYGSSGWLCPRCTFIKRLEEIKRSNR